MSGFAYSGWSDEQHVGGIGQVGTQSEFPYQFLVDGGLCSKVEVFQPPSGGEVRQFQTGFPSALFGGFRLDPQQTFEELGMSGVELSGLFQM